MFRLGMVFIHSVNEFDCKRRMDQVGGDRFARGQKTQPPPGKESIMDSLIKRDPFKDWDPFRELNEFQNRLGSFFGLAPARRGQEGFMSSEWAPSVDIIEDEKEFLVKAELPEVKKEDVHVTMDNGVLTIRGE